MLNRFKAAALAALCGLGAGSASADPIADFYKSQKISWVLSAGEGGGYASYARMFAPLMP